MAKTVISQPCLPSTGRNTTVNKTPSWGGQAGKTRFYFTAGLLNSRKKNEKKVAKRIRKVLREQDDGLAQP